MSKSTKTRKRTTAARNSRAPTGDDVTSTKPQRQDRSKRLLDLTMLLMRARTPVTFREIREQFIAYKTANVEAGLRAFERDKADLLELGVPVRYITPDEDDAIEEGGYVIELKRYLLPEIRLTAEEVSALAMATPVARAVPGVAYARIVDLALKKMEFDFPEPDTPVAWPSLDTEASGEPLLVHFPDATSRQQKQLGERFAQLEAATRNRKRVTLRYQSASTGAEKTRDVDPYGLVYREKSWLLVGRCHLRDDVRSFRLDRISDLKTAPKPKSPDFDRPGDFDVRAYAARSPWTFTPEPVEEVELIVRPEAATTADEDFGPDAVRTEREPGTVSITFRCGNPDYVVSRILAAKGGLVVARGAALKARLADELGAMRELYR